MERVDIASRTLAASPEAVWTAFADPGAWEQWLPPTGMTGSIDQFEFRKGGRYRLTLYYADVSGTGKTTANEDVSEGTFVELEPDRRLVQQIEFDSDDPAFAGVMQMTWSLEPVQNGTLVTITAKNVPGGISPDDHAEGLQSTLENLARFVES